MPACIPAALTSPEANPRCETEVSLFDRQSLCLDLQQLMNYSQFQIGFWHPFGPHGRESIEAILERKSRETGANGWTLWSFQRRRILDDWGREEI